MTDNKVKDEDLEKFAKELQDQIMSQLRQQYSAEVIDRWQNPRNFKRIENPDGYAQVKGSCGDSMEMFLKIEDDRIIDCGFFTDGCGTTIACGSIATEVAQGKSFVEALALVSADEILKRLGGLPEEDVHCAQLAVETMRRALADYLFQKKQSWKKLYRKVEVE
ncbi:MAG: iron-sulfur cluster assembly scaffold protein [Candidatus Aminicenantes bacterium]|nr:MAG: iron-sulfur cluster assembly scaffold protein [Candidatus Aminicenantes bacterium]